MLFTIKLYHDSICKETSSDVKRQLDREYHNLIANSPFFRADPRYNLIANRTRKQSINIH